MGSLHEAVRQALIGAGVSVRATGVTPRGVGWDFYDKWLFRVEDLAGAGGGGGGELPAGMRWDAIRDSGDAALVRARTAIPRKEATLLLLPNTAIRLDDGTPIAWAFLGLDGSLTSLHCEEPYRGRGLAKALAARLMRDHLGDFGDDGWCSADVSIRNPQSQGVCRSLHGKRAWKVSWFWVDLASVGDPL
ncbi:hypothetical protein QBC33DRAFT_529693 [Phialemonium atrogriseum]|uniref:N-acetyltransferase domain-containing protein n=1 Tax=Phialemonium atrogriseum TaxID=1093897 RepID=A0AAJ0C781_9PEZI|nr:uncharacterized protein QBC33DRAFT_529693 [Phialemonium atrogriseum]KAK1769954.1 hypothetical protein QBC33DRAFT_529693 [Phialemonium atrogriseum]